MRGMVIGKLKTIMYSLDILYLTLLASLWVISPVYKLETVFNGAMCPTVCEGDLLFVNVDDSIEVGDIIMYDINDSLLCRRVVDVTDGGYITQGDAIPERDTFILNADNYVGTVKWVVSNGVYWNKKIHSVWTFYILLCITIGVIIKD